MRSRLLTFVAAVVTLTASCAESGEVAGPVGALGDDAVTVGSFNFHESVLLGELYAQALEASGFRVLRELDLGPRELADPILQNGLIELLPEYAGSLLEFLAGGAASADLEETRSALRASLELRGLTALASAPAQSQNGFAVTDEFAREQDLHVLSDLAGEPALVLGGPPECPIRPLCQPGLESAYGIELSSFVALDASGPLTIDALERGVVDLALMFTTSAEIIRHGFVLLQDDRRLQPAEHITPVVHRSTLERFGPAFEAAIDAVSERLTTEELRALNAQVEIQRRTPADVARTWLVSQGLAPADG